MGALRTNTVLEPVVGNHATVLNLHAILGLPVPGGYLLQWRNNLILQGNIRRAVHRR